MTLAEITALIVSNVDTTGRRLTTGVKMRQVLDAIVAYLSGTPDFVYTGLVFSGGQLIGGLGSTVTMVSGGNVSVSVMLIFSRGKDWGDIAISGEGDAEFTPTYIPSELGSSECVSVLVLSFDSYIEGTYTYQITAGGTTKTLTIEVEGL
jgi:hypothetical protein